VVAPAIGWVLYNILQPALNQLNRMRNDWVIEPRRFLSEWRRRMVVVIDVTEPGSLLLCAYLVFLNSWTENAARTHASFLSVSLFMSMAISLSLPLCRCCIERQAFIAAASLCLVGLTGTARGSTVVCSRLQAADRAAPHRPRQRMAVIVEAALATIAALQCTGQKPPRSCRDSTSPGGAHHLYHPTHDHDDLLIQRRWCEPPPPTDPTPRDAVPNQEIAIKNLHSRFDHSKNYTFLLVINFILHSLLVTSINFMTNGGEEIANKSLPLNLY
jgi:hypothetical protein